MPFMAVTAPYKSPASVRQAQYESAAELSLLMRISLPSALATLPHKIEFTIFGSEALERVKK
jgi:hypothetical protein